MEVNTNNTNLNTVKLLKTPLSCNFLEYMYDHNTIFIELHFNISVIPRQIDSNIVDCSVLTQS